MMQGIRKQYIGVTALLAAATIVQPIGASARAGAYTNARYGFSITLPQGWSTDTSTLSGNGVIAHDPSDSSAIIVAFGYTPSQQDLRKDTEARVYTANHVPHTIQLLPVSVGKVSALRVIYYVPFAPTQKTQSVVHLETYLHASGKGYAVLCQATPSTFAKIRSSCLSATDSLNP